MRSFGLLFLWTLAGVPLQAAQPHQSAQSPQSNSVRREVSPSPERDLPAPEVQGTVALLGKRVETVPREGRLGTWFGWLGAKAGAGSFQVDRATDGTIRVLASHAVPGYALTYVRLYLREDGGRADAYSRGCAGNGGYVDLAGVACIVTDGDVAAVEAEVTCLSSLGPTPYFVRVDLGEAGVELGLALHERQQAGTNRRYAAFESNEVERARGTRTVEGHVDSLGRRQGPWSLHDSEGKRLLETTWKDGRLHGRGALRDEEGRLRESSFRRDGFLDGEVRRWNSDDWLRSIDTYADGLRHGLRVVFHENGRKLIEEHFEEDEPVGLMRRWDEGGVLVDESPSETFYEHDPVSWRRFRTELSAFHVRR